MCEIQLKNSKELLEKQISLLKMSISLLKLHNPSAIEVFEGIESTYALKNAMPINKNYNLTKVYIARF